MLVKEWRRGACCISESWKTTPRNRIAEKLNKFSIRLTFCMILNRCFNGIFLEIYCLTSAPTYARLVVFVRCNFDPEDVLRLVEIEWQQGFQHQCINHDRVGEDIRRFRIY